MTHRHFQLHKFEMLQRETIVDQGKSKKTYIHMKIKGVWQDFFLLINESFAYLHNVNVIISYFWKIRFETTTYPPTHLRMMSWNILLFTASLIVSVSVLLWYLLDKWTQSLKNSLSDQPLNSFRKEVILKPMDNCSSSIFFRRLLFAFILVLLV